MSSLKPVKSHSAFILHLFGSVIALSISSLFWTHDAEASCTLAPSGLVSWWRAENDASDSFSTNSGTLSGGASFALGEVGQGFSFDGTGEVVVPGTPSLNVTTFTFEAWVNPSVLDGNMEIILNKENNPAFNESDVSYELAIRGTADPGMGNIPVGHLSFYIGGINGLPGGLGSWVDGGGMVPTNQWSHCALTFDGTTVRVYVNGTLTRSIDGLSGTVIATTGPFKIGSRSALQVSAAPASRFNGLIDEVSVYSRVLSGAEIRAIYIAGAEGKCPTTNCATQPVGLASWWKGEGNTLDQIGNNNGTLVGNATYGQGRAGQGFLFDGQGSYLSVGASDSLRFTNQLSISTWIFPTGPGQHPQYGGIIVNKEGEYELARFADGTIGWAFANQGPIWTWLSSGAFAPLNQWTHVVLTFNNGLASAFLNGQFVQSNSGNPLIGDIYPSLNEFRIGNRLEGGQGFAGVIDEVAVFSRALTTHDVAAIYAAGSAGMCPPSSQTNCSPTPSGLVSWWRAENSTADTRSGNDGMVAGFGTVVYGPGEVGQAFVFDGTHRDRADVGNPVNLQLQDFTIEAWIKRSSPTVIGFDVLGVDGSQAGEGGMVFSYGRGGYGLGLLNSGQLILSRIDLDGVLSVARVSDTNWHHVAVTKAGSAAVFYIDGVPEPVPSYDHPLPYTFDTSAAIGSRGDARGGSFFGLIDEVAVFNRAVTTDELAAIYAAGSAGMCSVRPALSITLFVPPAGAVGATVIISGTGFDPVGSNNIVYFGPVQAMVASASPTALQVIVPAGATFNPITVTTGNRTAYSQAMFVPTFSSVGAFDTSSFATKVDFPAGNLPADLAIGDFDGDGRPDLVVANHNDNTFSVYRNLASPGTISSGSLAEPVNFATGRNPIAVAVGDLDGDGKLDLAVANHFGDSISIYRNTSVRGVIDTGSFASPIILTASVGPHGLAIQDMNGDGKPDLVVANNGHGFGNTVSVYRNISTAGSLAFADRISYEVGTEPDFLAVGDLDGDGKPDIAAMNFVSSTIALLRNVTVNGVIDASSFQTKVEFATGPQPDQTIKLGDLDGDGKLDIAVGTDLSGMVSVFRNTTSPSGFTIDSLAPRLTFDQGTPQTYVALGDVNGDSKPDLAIFHSGIISIFLNASSAGSLGPGSFAAKVDFQAEPGWNLSRVLIADLDGDGRPELIALNQQPGNNKLSILRNNLAPCITAPSGLVGWWRAENNAQDAADGNSGVLANGASFAAGKVGQAFSFDGDGDGIRIGNPASLRLQNLTIEGWVKRSSNMQVSANSIYGEIVGYGPGGYVLGFRQDGSLFLSKNTVSDVRSIGTITDTAWHHVAVTKFGNVVVFYLDGVSEPAIVYETTFEFNTDLAIGAVNSALESSFLGLIDELSIYNRALTAAEIQSIYNIGGAGKCASPQPCAPAASGLVSLWRAENNALDIAGGNPGVLVGDVGFGSGEVGQAFFLNGTNASISVPASASLDFSQGEGFSVECWINPAQIADPQPLVEWFQGVGPPWGVHFWISEAGSGPGPGCLYVNIADTFGGEHKFASAAGIVGTGTWQHVAVTYEHATGDTKLFYNGTVVAAQTLGFYTAQTSYPLYLGRRPAGIYKESLFDGGMDEVAMYNRALLTNEIAAIYNAGSAGKCLPLNPPPPVAPAITSQPTNLTVYAGSNATFRVTATGSAPLSYQWRFDGNDLPGKTSSVLTLTSVQFSNAGPYSVVVSNAAGTITSSNAILAVNPLPNCTPTPPGLVSWWRGEKTANDDWDSNNGATQFGLATLPGKVGSAFSFGRIGYIVVSDSPSLRFTNAFTLETWAYPTPTVDATPRTIISKFDYPLMTPAGTQSAYLLGTTNNGRLFLTVSATGSARTNTTLVTSQALPVNQWSFIVATYDGAALRLYINGKLAAQTNYTGGVFPGVANLGLGAISSGPSLFWPFNGLLDEISLYNRALTDDEIHAIFDSDFVGKCLAPPTIVGQPRDQFAPLGEDVKFTVSVTGSRPLKYQWRFNGVNLANATNSALVLEKVQTNRIGNYSVSASNALGVVTSSTAGLTLLTAPVCTDAPAGLISWWPADGNSADAMGANNSVSAAFYTTGKVDRAFSFNGISSRILVAPSTSLSFGSNADFSIEMWIKAGASNIFNSNVPLLEKHGPGTAWIGYSLSLNQGRIALAMGSSPISATNVSTFISPGPDLRDAMFHHVAASVNRTSTTGGHLYVDGQLVLTFDPTPRKGSLAANVSLFMGGPVNIPPVDSYFGGLIDEPAIYNRALSAEEIVAIRQAGAAGKCKVKPSILVQPMTQRVTIGSNVTFSVEATGTPLLRYQWLFNNGQSVPGATTSSFSFNVQNSLTVSVRVTNIFGSILSSNVMLIANHTPTASGQIVVLDEDTPTPITLLGGDVDDDLLNYSIIALPAYGTLSGTGSNVLYTPKPNYFGPDSFTFKVNDGLLDSIPATVSIDVKPVNDPPVPDASATVVLVLSPNNTNATVVLDGTRSFDVDSDTLEYRWFLAGSTNPIAAGVVAIVVLPVGTNSVSLAVSDGTAIATNTIAVEVITTAQAVERLVAAVNSDVSRSVPLIATLQAAIASIDRSNPTAAVNQLQAFQNQVRAQLEPLDSEAAQTLIQTAQEVIDLLGGGTQNSIASEGPQLQIDNLNHQSDGRLRMRFSTPSGKIYIVAASTNMLDWELIGVAVDQGDGTFEFEDRSSTRFPTRFYRIISP